MKKNILAKIQGKMNFYEQGREKNVNTVAVSISPQHAHCRTL
jgi:hypothetical protein